MGHQVDLRRRRRDRAGYRKKPAATWQCLRRDPLFLVGTGFVLGYVFSHLFLTLFYTGDPFVLFILHPFVVLVAVVALVCYTGWLLLRGDPRPARSEAGSEKQLLLAILDAGGSITPVEAALETSLAVDEAEEILTRFADRGHLVVEGRDGALFYSLPGRASSDGPASVFSEGPIPSSKTRSTPESSSPPSPREDPAS